MEHIIETKYLTWGEFHIDTIELAKKLTYKKWDSIIAVTRGGLIPASIIARELSIFSIDTICPKLVGNGFKILKNSEFDSPDSLIVDEFVSTGKLFRKVKEYLPNSVFVSVYVTEKSKDFVEIYSKEIKNRDIFFPWDTKLAWSQPIL